MLRFRLRTLLIVLALGPPVLAGVWLAYQEWNARQIQCAWDDADHLNGLRAGFPK